MPPEWLAVPIYGFACTDCEHEFEELVHGPSDVSALTCPKCRSRRVDRKLSVFAARSAAATPTDPVVFSTEDEATQMAKLAPNIETTTNGASTALAAFFSWLLPGLGHWWLGHRARGVIFFTVISVTFWGGVAVGGVRTTVSPRDNGPWIAAQLCVGPQALVALFLNNQVQRRPDQQILVAPWPAANIAVVYAGIAGLLNLLIIIDAMARCDAAARTTPARSPPKKGGG